MKLWWEKQNEQTWYAMSGRLHVATVGTRRDSSVYWNVHAVDLKGIAKGSGETTRVTAAKRSVDRAWASWLKRAELSPLGCGK